jgi:serine/threonine-protein kinase RsbW
MPNGKLHARRFEGKTEQLKPIRLFVAERVAELAGNEDDVFACELATDEAASNIFAHAYADQGGIIQIRVSREDDDLVISLLDWGTPFDPTLVPEPNLTSTLEERPPGGLGIYLIRKLMNHVSFHFDPVAGNSITMRRTLGQERSARGAQ